MSNVNNMFEPLSDVDNLLSNLEKSCSTLKASELGSRSALYSFLSDTMRAEVTISSSKAAFDELIECLKNRLCKKKVERKNSNNFHYLLKFVFHDDLKRVSSYARVLSVAKAKSISPDELAGYIESEGGIENIRTAKTKALPVDVDGYREWLNNGFLQKSDVSEIAKTLRDGEFGIVLVRRTGDERIACQWVEETSLVNGFIGKLAQARHKKTLNPGLNMAERQVAHIYELATKRSNEASATVGMAA